MPQLLKTYFASEIIPYLFPTNTFLSRAKNDDALVNFNTVNLQNAGALPDVVVDRNILPAPITQREDVPQEYTLHELTTDPTLIRDVEVLLEMGGFAKRQDILKDHAKQINTKAADLALVEWAEAAVTKIPTTGATRAASGPSQTGNRKKLTMADIIAAQQYFFDNDLILDNMDVQGIAIITPAMYADLLGIAQFTDADKYGSSAIPSGVLRRAFGFDFYVRSRVVVLNAANTVKAQGAAGAADDQNAAIFYHPDFVRRAIGGLKVYTDNDKPEYYGSIFSAMQRFGASPSRLDGKGIVLVYEDNA